MRISGLIIFLMLKTGSIGLAQGKFFTKIGKISFFSKAPLEDIEAHHKSVTCILDAKTGQLQFILLIKGFEFQKALMQEHFNENYMESDKFPKSVFRGQIMNNADIDYSKDGQYNARVQGKLTIRGETRDVETEGKITVKKGQISVNADFNIQLPDYKISVPGIVRDKISNKIKIMVDCLLEPL